MLRLTLHLIVFIGCWLSSPVHANVAAYISLDAESRTIFSAHNIDQRVRPASLAKLMTAAVVLRQVREGKLKLEQRVTVSAAAAGQDPVRVGLKAGKAYLLSELLNAAVIRSGNDAAAALAEAAAGSEEAFVALMNAEARTLGLKNTRFMNASGLPDPGAYTSARDIARLVLHVLESYPQHAAMFDANSFVIAGRRVRGRNRWLNNYQGANGMKTGFTCRAGYHLAASATRDAKTNIVVVLGARNLTQRFDTTRKLMDATWGTKPGKQRIDQGIALSRIAASAPIVAAGCLIPRIADTSQFAPSRWAVKLKVHTRYADALAESKRFIKRFDTRASVYIIPRLRAGIAYQAGASGFMKQTATLACKRAAKVQIRCIVQPPVVAHLSWNRAQKLAKAIRSGKKKPGKAKSKR